MRQKTPLLARLKGLLGRSADRDFTHVVPLGLSCRVTHQARTCFGLGAAYPFDWWISPLEGLSRYLALLDPQRIYGPGALEERRVGGRVESIRSVEFGVELYHEFPRRPCAGGSSVATGWQQHVPTALRRHERRLERLRDLDRPRHNILFLRHKYSVDPRAVAPADEMRALLAALRTQWPRAGVSLLLLNVPVDGPLPRAVRSVRFDDPPGTPPDEWRGRTANWRAAFESAQVRLDRRVAVLASGAPPISTGPPD